MARTLGPYELLRPLAQGGMAEVFLARRVSGGVEKRLVIKRIRRERASDPRFVAMFVEEARLSMALMHKNIVPVFDFGRAGDELFLAMELVDGPDLGAILDHARAHGTRLDPMLVAYIALEACQALDYAHHATAPDGSPRPLVHRDVTPRNVLMSRAGDVKLVDFGVASSEAALASGAGWGAIRGTPAYMAPEQARGRAVDGRADVFSLGLVMWEALAGRRAYEGRTQQELLAQARTGKVPALPDDEPDDEPDDAPDDEPDDARGARVPDALRRIVARATATDPAERYPSARAMQLALDEYLVAARAAASSAPPGHLLAAWIAERFPPEPRVTGREIAVPDAARDAARDEPAGRVVTFLDDGAGSVLGDAARATVRSLAETVAEPGPDAMPDAGPDAGPEHGAAPRLAADPMAETEPAILPPPAAVDRAPERTPAAARGRGNRVIAAVAGLAALGVALAVGLTVVSGRPHGPASARPAEVAPGPAAALVATPAAATGAPVPAVHAVDAGAPAAATTPSEPARAPAASEVAPGAEVSIRPKSPAGASPGTRPGRPGQHATRPGPRSTPAPSPGTTPAAAPAQGTIKISATPWARVTVAGSNASCNETPCVLQLPAGKHTLRLENPVAGLSKERQVDLSPGQTLVIRETLGP